VGKEVLDKEMLQQPEYKAPVEEEDVDDFA
jgi:hypothetical protein